MVRNHTRLRGTMRAPRHQRGSRGSGAPAPRCPQEDGATCQSMLRTSSENDGGKGKTFSGQTNRELATGGLSLKEMLNDVFERESGPPRQRPGQSAMHKERRGERQTRGQSVPLRGQTAPPRTASGARFNHLALAALFVLMNRLAFSCLRENRM